MLTAGTVVVLIAAAQLGAPEGGHGSGCAVIDSFGQCLVKAVDPGRPGGPRERAKEPARTTPSAPRTPGKPAVARADGAAPAAPATQRGPASESSLWSEFAIRHLDALRGLQNAAPARAAAAQSPTLATTLATITQQAIERLTLRPPVLNTSAGERGIVGVPVWLWIDPASAAPLAITATAGAAAVTATAQLTSVQWTMGPPGAVVRCTGTGTPWSGQAGPSPDCGYVYALRSLPERTDGRGTWTVTATCIWTVTFTGTSAGVPVADEETVTVSTSTELQVGEVQVLVDGDGS